MPPYADHAERVAWLKSEAGLPFDSAPTLELGPAVDVNASSKKIYLDHAHWVQMSKARMEKDVSVDSQKCYEMLASAVDSGEATVFLTESSYIELQVASGNINQRTRMANVMSELTRFAAIGSRDEIFEGQFVTALHDRFGTPVWPVEPKVYGRGFGWAFDGSKTKTPVPLASLAGADFVDQSFMEGLGDRVWELQEFMEYVVLRGTAEISGEVQHVFDVVEAKRLIEERTRADNYTQEQINLSEDLKTRVDDPICASIYVNDFGRQLLRLLSTGGITIDKFFHQTKDEIVDFLWSMPSIAVQIALRRQSAKNATRDWSTNDARDLDHHSLSVPYCDAVLTDLAAVDALTRAKIPEKLETAIFAHPRELTEWLSR